MKNYLVAILVPILFFGVQACNNLPSADLIVYNATIYTVDSAFSICEAMAIKDGKILATGTTEDILKAYTAKEKQDAKGTFIYPGLIDAHAHFVGYALGLQEVNISGTQSWAHVLDTVKAFASGNKEGWLIGNGWDQNDWPSKKFPTNAELNLLFPDRPVLLHRIDGHAAVANKKALELAGIRAGDKLSGGEIEVVNGQLTGILIDNAVTLVASKMPAPTDALLKQSLQAAEKNCFAQGLTTVADCGLNYKTIEKIKALQADNGLKLRLYIMLSDEKENYVYAAEKGIVKTDRMHIRSFKAYSDGALGSRGASLLEPYSDQPGHYGFLLSQPAHFDSIAAWIFKKGFQLCTHAIGDSGNRMILKVYEKFLPKGNDLRWRIEHAQVVNPQDFVRFGMYSIIPSVQPTHATSDMYWAADRLGTERIKTAYAYQQLLKQNGWLPLGTDFPIEDISPLKTFFAATWRTDAKGWPAGGFQTENALSRQQALRGMTIWAAKANFEEQEKGSLEKGKMADFIIVNKDLISVSPAEMLNTQVLYTFLGGEKVFSKN